MLCESHIVYLGTSLPCCSKYLKVQASIRPLCGMGLHLQQCSSCSPLKCQPPSITCSRSRTRCEVHIILFRGILRLTEQVQLRASCRGRGNQMREGRAGRRLRHISRSHFADFPRIPNEIPTDPASPIHRHWRSALLVHATDDLHAYL